MADARSQASIRWEDRQRWLMFLFMRKDLTPAQKLTGAAIVWHMNAVDGLCCPGMATIAFETNQAERTVRAHVAELNRLGLLGVERRGRAYRYSLGFESGTAVPLKPQMPEAFRDEIAARQRRYQAVNSGTMLPVCNSEQRHGGACVQNPIAAPRCQDSGTTMPLNSGTTMPPNLESEPRKNLEAEEAA
jgi:hypothetical protein